MRTLGILGLIALAVMVCFTVASPGWCCSKHGVGQGAQPQGNMGTPASKGGEDHPMPGGMDDNAVNTHREGADDASRQLGGSGLPGSGDGNGSGVRFTGDGSIRGSHLSTSPGTDDGGKGDQEDQTGAVKFLTQLLLGEAIGIYTKEEVDMLLELPLILDTEYVPPEDKPVLPKKKPDKTKGLYLGLADIFHSALTTDNSEMKEDDPRRALIILIGAFGGMAETGTRASDY